MCENAWYHTDEFIINVPTFTLHLLGMKFFSYQGLNYPFVRRPLKLKPRENPQSLKLHPSMQYAPN